MKNLDEAYLYHMPSGAIYHPSRLIHKDGTLMWKHALLTQGELNIPTEAAHEAHIMKTAQRLEELNSWVSLDNELWECLMPTAWYVPDVDFLSEGISLFCKHTIHNAEYIYDTLKSHVQAHEVLKVVDNQIYFQRC